jgi:hypothetical protein
MGLTIKTTGDRDRVEPVSHHHYHSLASRKPGYPMT